MSTATSLPEAMTAAVIRGKGGPEVLALDTIAVPKPGRGQVLIKVRRPASIARM